MRRGCCCTAQWVSNFLPCEPLSEVFGDQNKIVVPFIAGDKKGHDDLCLHYTNKTNVQQLCHICNCPFEESDLSIAKHKPHSSRRLEALVRKGMSKQLAGMSQRMLRNALAPMIFGAHNQHGVCAACPPEPLHQIQSGILKYITDVFFAVLKKKRPPKLPNSMDLPCAYPRNSSDRVTVIFPVVGSGRPIRPVVPTSRLPKSLVYCCLFSLLSTPLSSAGSLVHASIGRH